MNQAGNNTQLPRLLLRLMTVAMVGFLTLVVSPHDLLAERTCEGEQSGVWSSVESPYYIIGNIIVPEGEELVIQPEVEVIFTGNYHLSVLGTLSAIGNPEEDEKVYFYRTDDLLWQGIQFEPQSGGEISECSISNAWIAIDCNQSFPFIHNNQINAVSIGINCFESSPVIVENKFYIGGNNTMTNATGISLRAESNADIRRNDRIEVIGGAFGETIGIYVDRSFPVISENWIEVRSEGVINSSSTFGIFAQRTNKVDIDHNIIRVRSHSEMKGMWVFDATGVLFVNNDVLLLGSSSEAIALDIDAGSEVYVVNNILYGNVSSIGIRSSYGRVHRSSGYNDLWLHDDAYVGQWGGYNDIYENPYFVNESFNPDSANYELMWEDGAWSPCVDAGHPGYWDPDRTISDIGRYYAEHEPDQITDHEKNSVPVDYVVLFNHPNPFNSTTVINLSQPLEELVDLRVFDIAGREVGLIWNGRLESGKHTFTWNPVNTPSGIYLLMYESNSTTLTRKLVLQP